MKKSLLTLVAFCFLTSIKAQQFSFQLFFSDAIGNKDTITLGYDPNGTDSIDAALGEINIVSMPLNSNLDVRITNEWKKSHLHPGSTYHTKKQITVYNCFAFDSKHIQTIDVHTTHWPVTVSWDNSLFQDNCRAGSLITSITPGGWWDTGSPSNLNRAVFKSGNSVTFSTNRGQPFNSTYAYIKGSDTIPVFWQAIADISIIATSINELKGNKELNISPNPSFGKFKFSNLEIGSKLEIYDLVGRLVSEILVKENSLVVDLENQDKGVYIYKIKNSDNQAIEGKIILQ